MCGCDLDSKFGRSSPNSLTFDLLMILFFISEFEVRVAFIGILVVWVAIGDGEKLEKWEENDQKKKKKSNRSWLNAFVKYYTNSTGLWIPFFHKSHKI